MRMSETFLATSVTSESDNFASISGFYPIDWTSVGVLLNAGMYLATSLDLATPRVDTEEAQCQMPACSNCKNLKYSSLYFEKVQRPWSKVPKGVSIRQIIPKFLIPEHD